MLARKETINVEDINEELCFNLDNSRWLKHITHRLIDNEGYEYYYSVLSTEKLAKLVDEVQKHIKNKTIEL